MVAGVSAISELGMYLAGGVSKDYKLKLRQLASNLKDPNNPALRRKVLLGDIKPDALVRMESADMASEVRLSFLASMGTRLPASSTPPPPRGAFPPHLSPLCAQAFWHYKREGLCLGRLSVCSSICTS